MSKPDIEAVRTALRELLAEEPGEITRSAFSALSPRKQFSFCRSGGRITDDPPPAKVAPRAGYVTIIATRAEFDAMTPANQSRYLQLVGKLRD